LDELDLGWLRARPGQKWARARAAGEDVLACWVADMDFPTPAPVRAALVRLAASGDVGYPDVHESHALEPVWAQRMGSRFGWHPTPGRLRVFSDIIQAVQAVLYVMTAPGDGVLLFTPSYPPFVEGLTTMGRRLLPVPALSSAHGWQFDLEAVEEGARRARALLLVNPHNPTGRMLNEQELAAVAQVSERHDLLVISDEVHADLTLAGRRHIPFASLAPALEARTITLYSASKSHNLGGMRCAVAHMGNLEAERRLRALPPKLLGRVSIAAVAATLASWSEEGDQWLEQALGRLRVNRSALSDWLSGAGAMRGIRGYPPEGTYMCWLDFRATSIGGNEDPAQALVKDAGVLLSGGPAFGPGGTGFARLNFATTPAVLEEILSRLGRGLDLRQREGTSQEI